MSREFCPRRIIGTLGALRDGYKEYEAIRNEGVNVIIGEHMVVTIWPNDPLAELNYHKSLPRIMPDEGLMSYSRNLLDQTKRSLTALALLCRNNDPRLDGVTEFEGVSHLVGSTAKKLGFDVSEIPNRWEKTAIELISTYIAIEEGWRNKQRRRFFRKLVEVKVAHISRQRLMERFLDIQS